MRKITKTAPNRFLENRNRKPPNSATKANSSWNRFRQKSQTSRICYTEQYGLCGYSEISIDNIYPILDENSIEISRTLGSHLEHVEPKSKNPQRTFDHTNLIMSAIDDIKARKLIKEDVFGGHFKLRRYSENSFISPLSTNSRSYFHYETSGRIVPSYSLPTRREKAKARLTIYILNLNAPILVNLRKSWLTQLDNILFDMDKSAINDFALTELLPTNDCLRPFHSAQRQLFGKLGESICDSYNL
ncbi:retron system putative HNH endonuclease [Shewanella sp. 10N.286.45.A1]|uniref:retron system putative HNH endonuclease n=1 Tax=Shewanella sp. 10N.286.45.A1 TaxID=3229694 RepID=UPI00354CE16E